MILKMMSKMQDSYAKWQKSSGPAIKPFVVDETPVAPFDAADGVSVAVAYLIILGIVTYIGFSLLP